MEQGNHGKGALNGYAQAYVVTTALLLIAALGTSRGYAAEPKIQFNIAASNVPHALVEFSRQAHLQVLFMHPDKLVRLTTTPVVGEYSPAEALTLMLRGIPVAFEFDDGHVDTAVLFHVPAEWDSSSPVASLDIGLRGAPSLWATATAALPN